MLSLRLDPDIERRLAKLAKLTGHSKSYYARQLIEGNLEDRCSPKHVLKSAVLRFQTSESSLAWNIEYDPGALKDLKQLDRSVQNEILD